MGLASMVSKATRSSEEPEPERTPTPAQKLTEELKLKLARLRKLQFLLANPPADEPETPDGDGWWSGLKSWTSSLGSRSCLPSVPVPVVASASG